MFSKEFTFKDGNVELQSYELANGVCISAEDRMCVPCVSMTPDEARELRDALIEAYPLFYVKEVVEEENDPPAPEEAEEDYFYVTRANNECAVRVGRTTYRDVARTDNWEDANNIVEALRMKRSYV
jgi:hypothetical protein